jgi:hypothetical protein
MVLYFLTKWSYIFASEANENFEIFDKRFSLLLVFQLAVTSCLLFNVVEFS